MTRRSERLTLDHPTPGAPRELLVHRYGTPGARPKAYFQASLHADEVPAMLTARHLLRRLDAAAAEGAIAGEIVVVPYANPLGLSQFVSSEHIGRYELGGGGNFNRNWPDLYTPIAERLGARLCDSEAENVAAVRAAMAEHLAGCAARDALDGLRLALARLAARYPDHPIPAACLATTLELRGQADVTEALAERDAGALFRALQRHGVIAGDPGPLPEALCDATGFDACETLRAPSYGIVTYAVALGDHVRKGDLVARLSDPAGDPAAAAREIRAGTDGLVLSLRDRMWRQPGETIAKIAGRDPLPGRQAGNLLDD